MKSTILILGIAAVTLCSLPTRSMAVCNFFQNTFEEPPFPPDFHLEPHITCSFDGVLHYMLYDYRCDGTGYNASRVETYISCYDTRYDPPRCRTTFYRGTHRCSTSSNSDYQPFYRCNDPCDTGEHIRRMYLETFETPPETPKGDQLYQLKTELDAIHQRILDDNGQYLPQQLAIVNLADLTLHFVDTAFEVGEDEIGNEALIVARNLADMVVDFTPGLSLVKDAIVIVTGSNPITGEVVSNTERALIFASLLVPAAASGAMKATAKAAKILTRVVKRGKAGGLADKLLDTIKLSDSDMLRYVDDLPCSP